MEFRRFQDINVEDAMLKQEYYNLMFKGSIDSARQIYNNNPQLQTKIINAENLNILLNNILELEWYYINGVIGFLDNELAKLQISLDELVYARVFNNTEQYEINNFVAYNDEMYFCYSKPPIGTLPTDTTYWVYLGLRGEKGYTTLGINYRGIWEQRDSYIKDDMVQYNNQLYVAKINNSGVKPIDGDTWLLAMDIKPLKFYISETEPSGLSVGDVWIKLVKEV